MKNKTGHTPTPWEYHLGRGKYPRFHIQTTSGYQIASTPELDSLSKDENEGRANDAAFIVRAVNSHDGILDALKQAVNVIGKISAFGDDIGQDVTKAEIGMLLNKMSKAIANAEKGEI